LFTPRFLRPTGDSDSSTDGSVLTFPICFTHTYFIVFIIIFFFFDFILRGFNSADHFSAPVEFVLHFLDFVIIIFFFFLLAFVCSAIVAERVRGRIPNGFLFSAFHCRRDLFASRLFFFSFSSFFFSSASEFVRCCFLFDSTCRSTRRFRIFVLEHLGC
jgi:hypothetical protein